jgi:hypothetical protein
MSVRKTIKEQAMKQIQGVIVAALLAVTVGLADTSALFTEPVLVDAARAGRHWGTVYTNAVPLSWNWDATNAVRATLSLTGMNGSFSTNFTAAASNWLWRVSETDVPATEDVYTLTLSFFSASDAVVGVMTSRLAVVTGAFGETLVDPVSESKTWARVKNNVIVPYNAMWAADGTNAVSSQVVIAKIGGAVQTNAFPDVSGYMGWKIQNSGWGYGAFDLSLTFTGATNSWTAELTRPLDGTMIRMQ